MIGVGNIGGMGGGGGGGGMGGGLMDFMSMFQGDNKAPGGGQLGGSGGAQMPGPAGAILKMIGMKMKKGAAGLIADEGLKASDKPWVGNKGGQARAMNFTPSGLAQFWGKLEQNPALKEKFLGYLQQGKINRPAGGFRQGGMQPSPF